MDVPQRSKVLVEDETTRQQLLCATVNDRSFLLSSGPDPVHGGQALPIRRLRSICDPIRRGICGEYLPAQDGKILVLRLVHTSRVISFNGQGSRKLPIKGLRVCRRSGKLYLHGVVAEADDTLCLTPAAEEKGMVVDNYDGYVQYKIKDGGIVRPVRIRWLRKV